LKGTFLERTGFKGKVQSEIVMNQKRGNIVRVYCIIVDIDISEMNAAAICSNKSVHFYLLLSPASYKMTKHFFWISPFGPLRENAIRASRGAP